MADTDDDQAQDEFPHLAQLLAAYLNQDFSVHGGTLDDAVNAYLADSSAEEAAAARVDIAKFLAAKGTGTNLDAELRRLCWDYSHDPNKNAREHLVWLDGLLARGLPG